MLGLPRDWQKVSLEELLTVDNVNFYYNFKPKGDHEYTLV